MTSTYLLKKEQEEEFLYIAKRYAKANNKCMNDYDLEKQSTFITYLDKNNFCGWPMSEYLRYEKFEWLENIDELNVMSINEKSDIGYILEVDLEYPKELHELKRKTCCF